MSTWWTQSSQIGQVFYHGRDARATMASWHGRPGHDRKLDRFVNFVSTKLVSGAKLAPQVRLRKAQGASPGNKDSNNGSPEGAMQWVPVPKTCLMTSMYLELRPNSLRRPFRAFRNLDLEPRARALGCPT